MADVNSGSTASDGFGLAGQMVAARFQVDELVAEGGFGLVYRAQQVALRRPVALKVLKPADLGPAGLADFHRRFEAEARLVASLKHPHIVEVYDFGVSDSARGEALHWMALEWLEGQTLEGRLGTRMDPAAVLALLRPVFQAVGFAHRRGVAHRDLKPANIFLAQVDGRVVPKVLDFGIASIMTADAQSAPGSGAGKAAETTRGFQAFSPDHAAPEQVGYGRTGPFTDVHALGLITSELLTGVPPYPAGEPEVRLQAIVGETRPTPGSKGVPAGAWEAVLVRAVARRPADRYQSADELLAALEQSLPAATAASTPSTPPAPAPARWRRPLMAALAVLAVAGVAAGGYFALRVRVPDPDRIVLAVLPFRNLTGDPKQENLSDAFTDGAIGQLGRLGPEQLSVIGRASMTRYKNTGKSAGEIGQELGVGYLLDASIKRQGDELRVDAHLVRVSDQIAIWSDSFTGQMEDVQGLQNDLARGVARGIRLKLGASAELALVHKRPVKPAAYEAYLRAHFSPFDGPDVVTTIRNSLAAYEEAVTIDPTFALAHAGLAMTLIRLSYGPGGEELQPRARAAALRAIELDGELAQAQGAMGGVLFQLYGDWAGGERYLRRALELDPNQWEALETISRLWLTMGRFTEAIAARTRAVEIDPLSSFVSRNLGGAYYFARQYDAAIDVLQRTIAADEKFLPAHKRLALCYAGKGMLAAAAAQEDRVSGYPQNVLPANLSVRGYVLARVGRVEEARRIVDRLIEQARVRPSLSLDVARVRVGLGEREETLRLLEKAHQEHHTDIIFLRVDPMWDPVRADPRFIDLARRVGIPPLARGG